MTSIGFIIENLSYNWSIITYRDSNKNSTKVFCSIKLINKKAIQIYECCANTLIMQKIESKDIFSSSLQIGAQRQEGNYSLLQLIFRRVLIGKRIERITYFRCISVYIRDAIVAVWTLLISKLLDHSIDKY